jgi:hypothetical protein
MHADLPPFRRVAVTELMRLHPAFFMKHDNNFRGQEIIICPPNLAK